MLPGLVALSLLAAGGMLTVMPPGGLTPVEAQAAGLAVAALGLWATGVIPEALTALAFFTVAMLARVAPPSVVLSGLQSSAFWLIFSGLVLGAALKRSGLGDRIAGVLSNLVGADPRAGLLGAVGFGLVMAFLMPSAMGRVMVMLPILSALAERRGHDPGSRGHRGLVVGGIYATILPSAAILPSNVPNNVLAGIVEARTGMTLSYADYLLMHFPVLGLMKALLLAIVLLVLYGRHLSISRPAVPNRPVASLSAEEWRMAIILGGALALWLTDPLHRIPSAWVGMAAAVLCLLPRCGVLPPKALQSINFEPVFYVGGIISLAALVDHAGLISPVAAWILPRLPLMPGANAGNFFALSSLASVIGMLVTVPGVPAVLTPLTEGLAAAAGLSPDAVLATQVVGFSTVFLPYQAPPLVAVLAVSDLPRRDVLRVGLVTALLTMPLLWPLDLLWLQAVGRFP